MSEVRWKDLDGEYVKAREGDCDEKLSDNEADGFGEVPRDELRDYAEDATADHAEEKRLLSAYPLHQNIGDEVAWQLDETDDL